MVAFVLVVVAVVVTVVKPSHILDGSSSTHLSLESNTVAVPQPDKTHLRPRTCRCKQSEIHNSVCGLWSVE